jgi:predicted dehydrogenase
MALTIDVIPDPHTPSNFDAPVLQWGLLAPGGIAEKFATAVIEHTGQQIVGVASRSLARAQQFAARHNIPSAYGSYKQLVESPNIDVVYIAAPHSEHKALALLAIAAGKSVLVEKPFAIHAADAREIVNAARSAGVFAMEAMWSRYLPQSDIVRQLLAAGVIGQPQIVTADFGFAFAADQRSRMYRPELGGGSLLDMGVYVVSFASSVLGSPDQVQAVGSIAESGVDTGAGLLLHHPDGSLALLSSSMQTTTPVRASIVGTEGRIDVHGPFFMPSALTVHSNDFGSEPLKWRDHTGLSLYDGLSYEAAALATYVTAGLVESPLHPLEEVVAVLETLDSARSQLS